MDPKVTDPVLYLMTIMRSSGHKKGLVLGTGWDSLDPRTTNTVVKEQTEGF